MRSAISARYRGQIRHIHQGHLLLYFSRTWWGL